MTKRVFIKGDYIKSLRTHRASKEGAMAGALDGHFGEHKVVAEDNEIFFVEPINKEGGVRQRIPRGQTWSPS